VIPTDSNTFLEPPDTTDSLSTLSSHCDHGKVYRDVGELELEGSRSSHEVSEKFQRMLTQFVEPPDTMDSLSTLSRHCDIGEVYLDVEELELDGTRSSHEVSD